MAEAKKPINRANAWAEARVLLYANRGRLAVGLGVLLVNRAAGFVLPASSKLLFDRVIPHHDTALLTWLVVMVLASVVVEAVTGFALAQLSGPSMTCARRCTTTSCACRWRASTRPSRACSSRAS